MCGAKLQQLPHDVHGAVAYALRSFDAPERQRALVASHVVLVRRRKVTHVIVACAG